MPELPEVETVKEILKTQIIGQTIKDIDIYYQGILENVSKDKFKESLKGEEIIDLNRYGKYLIIICKEHSIISHLRMEGKFFIKDEAVPLEKHEHIVFKFNSGKTLRYHDTRKFGKMVLLKTTDLSEIMQYPALSKLGLEANDPTLSVDYLMNHFKNKNVSIKPLLLDQSVIAGLGNIYVDEVCFLSKINPEEKACNLSREDAKNIIEACQKTLSKAISEGGTTIRSYTSSLGVTGRFQQHLLVHTKVNEPCPNCKMPIVKIKVGGRGTYLCPKCQKLKKTIVGLTGVIGSGKSTVTNYLTSLGYLVIDSDKIVENLYQQIKVIKLIEENFGKNCILDNQINRKVLGELVFNNQDKREKLNNLIHPLVKKEIKKQINEINQPLIFVDVPLLYEAHFEDLFDETMVIYANTNQIIKRLITRDHLNQEQALAKINSQMEMIKKCSLADFIIDNSLDLCYTYKQINELIEKLS